MSAGKKETTGAGEMPRAKSGGLLCFLPQYPRNKTEKILSLSCNQTRRGAGRGRNCHNTPVTNGKALAPCKLRKMGAGAGGDGGKIRAKVCRNTPVTSRPFCRNTPVTKRVFCRNTPVTTFAQVVDYQGPNFLEIILRNKIRKPSCGLARGGGRSLSAIGAYKEGQKNSGRTFQNRTAGTPRPAGP
jgi:hypothetical protein